MEVVERFMRRNPSSAEALARWAEMVNETEWHNPHDALALHSNARTIGRNRLIFNIRGNRFRLVAQVDNTAGLVTVRFIGSHGEYNRIDARKV